MPIIFGDSKAPYGALFIVVQGAAINDLMTGDYKPDNAFDTIRHILYRKNKPK